MPFDVESAYAAAHDALTGLPNRDHLAATLDAMADDRGDDVLLVVVEIDALALVDRLHGRAAGDELVVDVARRVERVAGPWAIVGQLERNRLALLLPRAGAPLILRRVRRQVESAELPWRRCSAARGAVERAS